MNYRQHPGIGGTDIRAAIADYDKWRYMRQLKQQEPDSPWLESEKPSPAMELGTLIHTALLQPWVYDADAVIMPPVKSFATLDGKRTRRAAEAEAKDKGGFIVRHEHNLMIAELRKNWEPVIRSLCLEGIGPDETELELYGTRHGIACKGMADLIIDGCVLADLKTISNWTRRRDAIDGAHYNAQLAHYLDLAQVKPPACAIIFAETEPPFRVELVIVSPESIDRGLEARNQVLKRLASEAVRKGPL